MPISNNDNITAWSDSTKYVLDAYEEEGDFSRKFLLNSVIFELLGDVDGKSILDAGSGSGYLSRMLAKRGAIVTSIEAASGLLTYAQQREQAEPLAITFIHADLSTWKPTTNTFDAIISNMVLMDIPNYQEALQNCITALKPNGVFVFSILHPCFEESVNWNDKQSVATSEYFQHTEMPQFIGHTIHRPLSEYLNFVIDHGCSITRVVEPQLSDELSAQYTQQRRDNHVPSFIVIKVTKND